MTTDPSLEAKLTDKTNLVAWLNKAAKAIYAATDRGSADDISDGFKKAADRIAQLEADNASLIDTQTRNNETIEGLIAEKEHAANFAKAEADARDKAEREFAHEKERHEHWLAQAREFEEGLRFARAEISARLSLSDAARQIEKAVNAEAASIAKWCEGELQKARSAQPDNPQDNALLGERQYVLKHVIAAIRARTLVSGQEG